MSKSETEPLFLIKMRKRHTRVSYFLTTKGGLNRLRIHAAQMTRERVAQVMDELVKAHGEEYVVSMTPAYKGGGDADRD